MELVIGIAVVAIVILLIARSRQSSGAATRKAPQSHATKPATITQTSKYHAVSIEFGDSACAAARAMEGTRLLSSTSPQLPLADCDATNCECRFRHHRDRRSNEDRRDPYRDPISGDTGKFKKEQRHRADRRNSDPMDYFS